MSTHDWYHVLLIFWGALSVHIWQWIEREWTRRRQIKKGLRFECRAKGCEVSAWGDYPETIAEIRKVHYEQYPEHAHV